MDITDKQYNCCKGCRSLQHQCCIIDNLKQDGFLNEIVNCPCSTCLVKVMCTNGCKEYNNYTAKIEAMVMKYDREH